LIVCDDGDVLFFEKKKKKPVNRGERRVGEKIEIERYTII